MVYHEGYSPSHRIERFLPDGRVDLVIDLSDDAKHVCDSDTLAPVQTCRCGWVSGMRTRHISIPAGSESAMIVVSFSATGSAPFFLVPMHELADSILDAESVLGSGFRQLRERLLLPNSPTTKLHLVEEWLGHRFRHPVNGHHLAATAARIIDARPQLATIDSVAVSAGVSGKHLVQVFREYAGVTPKQYQRIKRFQAVVSAVVARLPSTGLRWLWNVDSMTSHI